MSFLEFLAGRWSEILGLTLEHVVLVVISTVAGVLIAVPLGLAITRIPALGRPVLGFAGVIQTVPSLALFGLLIPLPLIGGIGSRTAIIALVLYALLPILRNTVTGVRQVDPAILDAANGMGMTDWQRLTLVEVPLALPSIFSGIRIATVVGVGLVTIAAAVGAGGLGSLIFRGLAMLDSRLLFAGAIPSAILALLADGGLAMLEARLVASRGAPTS
ncbi:MAG: ABC transporter permease [Acidobacteriota bacterium]|nr:ABC transporter permease [Acidobacteriota bacterium]MDE2711392.1 ABC transporter permease [Acidobacteriota bacterium]MXW71600.1 ABC transporter permease [Acidobacteriota bacterium]MXX85675.1 ABC transporter permease [Acidobacteriota bacterium]MYE43588.1 ABC transporter permease [Acidobacteriota bacterium]